MDINQLNCFISAAQTLNFSEAARRNYVSQSTVSRYIGELEKELGTKLFTRSHRDVIITKEGKTFLSYALDIVGSLKKAKNEISRMREGGEGRLRIACDVTSLAFPARCVSAFSKKYPNITVELKPLVTDDFLRALSGGEFDFCFLPRDMTPESSELETLSTHTDSLVTVCSPNFGRPGGLKELNDSRLLLLSEAAAPILYMEIMDLLRAFHVVPGSEETYNDLNSLWVAIAAGMGVSILPRSFAKFISESRAEVNEIDDAETGIAYVAAWARGNDNPVIELFRQTVEKLAVDEDNVYGI